MRETTTLPNFKENEEADIFALITPSASPPAHRAALNVRTEVAPRPSYKRSRIASIGSASTAASPSSSSRTTFIDPTRDEAWRASSQRLLSVWDTLAERYSVPEEDDDIVDIISGKIITDRGVTRSLKKHGLKFGHLLLGSPEPEPTNGDEETSEDGEQTEVEDEVDEIDAFASEPEVPIKVEIEKEARILPPFSEMDPEDAQDLKEFLEEERRLKERAASGVKEGERDAEEGDAADSGSSAKTVSKREETRVMRGAFPPRIPTTGTRPPATSPENESEDELAKWEIDDSSAPVVPHTPKRSKTLKRLATPKARATPRPNSRDKSPPLTVIDLTQDSPPPDIQVLPRTANVEEHLLPISRPRESSDTQFKIPSYPNRSPTTRRIHEIARNLQLQTPPISTRSSSSASLDVIPPKVAQDPYQAAADLFFEPTPPPLRRTKPPVTPKTRRTLLPSKSADNFNKFGGFEGRKGSNAANSSQRTSNEENGKQQRTLHPGSSRAKSKPRHLVEVVVSRRVVQASGISTRGAQSVMGSSDLPDSIDGTPGDLDPSPRLKSSKATGKERERYTPKHWADLSDDDDLPPPPPRRSVSRTPMPSRKALQETRKRKRPSSSRSLSPVSPKDKVSVSPRPSRARDSRQVGPSRARSTCQPSDEEDEPQPRSTNRHVQRSQSRPQSNYVPRSSLPFAFSYPAPPSQNPFSPHSSSHSPSYPPPHDPLQDPQSRYHLAQAVQYLSYFLPRFPPPPSARFPPYANGYPPPLPRHEPEWLPQTPRASRSRLDSNLSPPIPEPSFDTPRRHSHPYPYAIDPMYSSPTDPPLSSSPAPSSPAAEARSSPVRGPRSPSISSRARSKSRMRRVSFKFDSDLEDPPSVRGRQTRDAADNDKSKTPGKRKSGRRASSVGPPATPPKPSRRQASQGPAGRRSSLSGDESDALRPGSPVHRKARGRTPGPSSHHTKGAAAPGRWR